jgi:hypothetical protein
MNEKAARTNATVTFASLSMAVPPLKNATVISTLRLTLRKKVTNEKLPS